jgi:hypothetical protein
MGASSLAGVSETHGELWGRLKRRNNKHGEKSRKGEWRKIMGVIR